MRQLKIVLPLSVFCWLGPVVSAIPVTLSVESALPAPFQDVLRVRHDGSFYDARDRDGKAISTGGYTFNKKSWVKEIRSGT